MIMHKNHKFVLRDFKLYALTHVLGVYFTFFIGCPSVKRLNSHTASYGGLVVLRDHTFTAWKK